jgi:hypothetical protein
MSEPNTNKRSETDWAKVDALSDEQIDLSDMPELDAEWFRKAKLVAPAGEAGLRVSVDLDPRTAAWYARQGPDRDRMLKAALKIYADAHTG